MISNAVEILFSPRLIFLVNKKFYSKTSSSRVDSSTSQYKILASGCELYPFQIMQEFLASPHVYQDFVESRSDRRKQIGNHLESSIVIVCSWLQLYVPSWKKDTPLPNTLPRFYRSPRPPYQTIQCLKLRKIK